MSNPALAFTMAHVALLEELGAPLKLVDRFRSWLRRTERQQQACDLLPKRGADATAAIVQCSRASVYGWNRAARAKNVQKRAIF